ncbi:tobe domain protein [Flavobacterium sufflavum]|uniref:Tobe domain protein n=1 Tax=Flavobacterium sufflavum TaxID=1921138 RepID=A0A3S2V6F1_9FLAO|nr:TOBE domain-containing protein [Flavobacterium sufflavum]RVT78357.1 tobe domain protein [Flavobacterium sufflavum]
MNLLTGEIIAIKTEGSLSLVKVMVQDCAITSIVIETPETATYLRIDNKIKIVFKETEVVLAKAFSGAISLQNKLDCNVHSFEKGKLLCKIILNFQNTKFASVITRNAFDQLDIKENDLVQAMIKTNEISLATHD